MAVYIITSKLGAGKTLMAVHKARQYLEQKRQVAINIDLKLEKLCKADNDYSRVVRLPDLPSSDDFDALGFGCEQYDEERFGGIFLDEAGIWLNSRDWSKGGRKEVLAYFKHLRKRRWDLFLLIQNINSLDKQVREDIAEHVIYLTRSDRFKLPVKLHFFLFLVTLGMFHLIWFLTMRGFKFPKMHHAITKYGTSKLAPVVGEDWFKGEDLYKAYDTTQEYQDDYDVPLHSLLPPAYLKRRLPAAQKNKDFYMRMTKIYWKRFKSPASFITGMVLTVCLMTPVIASLKPDTTTTPQKVKVQNQKQLTEFKDYKIKSFSQYPDGFLYEFHTPQGVVTSRDLNVKGITVRSRSSSEALIVKEDAYVSVFR
ncbi:zonular occludens toxin domain-containing protein [Endozoicomonas acroporae]|uniref:zonular occludens toxin domain-containing protein n=1 Tax=Endozoicomonas acroporae TaxID=1701104 RepID=UPI003D7A3DA4